MFGFQVSTLKFNSLPRISFIMVNLTMRNFLFHAFLSKLALRVSVSCNERGLVCNRRIPLKHVNVCHRRHNAVWLCGIWTAEQITPC